MNEFDCFSFDISNNSSFLPIVLAFEPLLKTPNGPQPCPLPFPSGLLASAWLLICLAAAIATTNTVDVNRL